MTIMIKSRAMKIPINWQPTDRQLRQFGLVAVLILPAAAWFWANGAGRVVGGAAVAGGVLGLVGWVRPRALRPVFLALSLVAFPVGFVVQELMLALVFALIFVPLGLVFRGRGRDPLQRQFDRTAPTYWQHKPRPPGVASYYRRW